MQEPQLFLLQTFNGVPTEDIEHIFNYWKTTFNKRNTTVLDDTRKKKIAAAIKAYGKETCEQAIAGCALSPWHTGQNPGNKQYTDLSLILRNADKVEQFVAIWENETAAERKLNDWLNS